MWPYIRRYLPIALLGALLMVGEVAMDLLQPSLMSSVVDDGILGAGNGGVADLGLIGSMGLLMVAAALFGGFCGSGNGILVNIATRNAGNDMRKDAFARIMELSVSQVESFGVGSLITRTTNDIGQIEMLLSTMVRGLIRTGLLMFGSIFFMFTLNVTFGCILLVSFPVALGIIVFSLKRLNPLFPRLQAQLDEINAIMQEDLSGVRAIKAWVNETYEKARFGTANGKLIITQLRALTIMALMNPSMNVLMYLIIGLILAVGGYSVSGDITPGVVMAAITYATRMLNSMLMVVMLFQDISRGTASWRRVRQVLDAVPQIQGGSFQGAEGSPTAGQVSFEEAGFTYPGASGPALADISLTIPQGQTVAIMGATGSGKTTLALLINRMLDATQGTVRVEGADVRDWDLGALRATVAMALQGTEILDRSVRDNIAAGRDNLDDQCIAQAAGNAQAHGFVSQLDAGYGTVLGQRGMTLSGGQRQRIGLARALAQDSRILVLDDATSALDTATEAAVQRALATEYSHLTVVMVVQRIAAARRADRIIVLENGRIVGDGTHDQLLRDCSVYQDIYRSQTAEGGDDHGE